jgi:hypothetical protein
VVLRAHCDRGRAALAKTQRRGVHTAALVACFSLFAAFVLLDSLR